MIFMRGLSQAVNIVTFVVLVEENKDFTECGDKWLGKLHQCGNSGPSLQLGRPCRVNYLALDIFPSLPPSWKVCSSIPDAPQSRGSTSTLLPPPPWAFHDLCLTRSVGCHPIPVRTCSFGACSALSLKKHLEICLG